MKRVKILSIEKIGKKNVIDIEVKKNHNFVLENGILSHNCQSASETKGLVQGSEDFLLMFKTTSWRDKMEMCDELKREKRMRQDQVSDLGFLEPGQVYVAETGRVVRKVQIILPRTMYWKKDYGNFYRNLWERFGGEWLYTESIRDYIEEKCKPKKTTSNISQKETMPMISQEVDNSKEPSFEDNTRPLLGEYIELPDDIEVTPTEVIKHELSDREKKKIEKERILQEALERMNSRFKK